MINNSSKNKIQKLYRISTQQEVEISNVSSDNNTKNKQISDLKNISNIYNKFQQIKSDWEDCTILYDLRDEEQQDYTGEQIIQWAITLGYFDIRLLQFLKIDILYKAIDNSFQFPDKFALKNIFFEYKDLNKSEYTANVIIHVVGYFLENTDLQTINPLQAKVIAVWDEIPLVKKQLVNNETINFNGSLTATIGWQDGKPEDGLWVDQGGGPIIIV